jgi:type II secretory pathway component PulJ
MRALRAATNDPRRGFSIVEMVVSTFLSVVLCLILGTVWAGLCRPIRDASTRCRLALQANLAVAALARDLSGFLVNPDDPSGSPDGRTGSSAQGRLAGLIPASPDDSSLQLCYVDSNGSKYRVNYTLASGRCLVRSVVSSGTTVTIASELSRFSAQPWSGDAGHGGVLLTMVFYPSDLASQRPALSGQHDLSMTYSLVVRAQVLDNSW